MLIDIGVLPDSRRFYHEADAFTLASLFSIPHAGIYHCAAQYVFERSYLDVCQALLVDEGGLMVEYRGETLHAPAGTLVLLSCAEPHRYHACDGGIRMRWFHFTGGSSMGYTNHIINTHGIVRKTAQNAALEPCFSRIMAAVQQGQPEPHMLSLEIHRLLALLAQQTEAREKSEMEQVIARAVDYMETHYADRSMTIDDLAARCALSPCYFLRKFKEFQETTPRQHLLAIRLRAAKQQLTTTAHSIEAIGLSCGFSSTSHFIMTFRKHSGMTPLQFRMKWL